VNGFGWPDLLIVTVALIGALMGLRRGFVAALTGFVAVAVAIFAAFRYQGSWDGWVIALTHLNPSSGHVVAMSLFAIAAYVAVVAAGFVLGGFAKLPGLGLINALLGAVVGVAEAAALLWAVLYIALFFPMPKELRADLARSPLVGALTAPNAQVDGTVKSLLPGMVRPFVGGFFAQHKP
jgi:membrane protein required for colicin V production